MMKRIVSIGLIVGAIFLALDVYRDASIHDKRLLIVGLYFVAGVYTIYSFINDERRRGIAIAFFLAISALLLLFLEGVLYLLHKNYSRLQLYDLVLAAILFKGCFNLITHYIKEHKRISNNYHVEE